MSHLTYTADSAVSQSQRGHGRLGAPIVTENQKYARPRPGTTVACTTLLVLLSAEAFNSVDGVLHDVHALHSEYKACQRRLAPWMASKIKERDKPFFLWCHGASADPNYNALGDNSRRWSWTRRLTLSYVSVFSWWTVSGVKKIKIRKWKKENGGGALDYDN